MQSSCHVDHELFASLRSAQDLSTNEIKVQFFWWPASGEFPEVTTGEIRGLNGMNTTTMTPALEFGCATSISPTLFASVALQAEPPVQVTSAAADATPLADSASNSNSTTARVSARRQSLLHKRQIQQEQQDEHDRVMAQQHAAAQHERRRKLKESHERRRKEKEAQLQLAGHTTGTKLLKARTGKDAGLVSAATTESYEKDPRKQEQLMSNLLEMLGKFCQT